MIRLFDCGVLLRIFILAHSAMFCYGALTQPALLVYRVAHADHFTLLATAALGMFTALSTIDLMVNDILPDAFFITRALRDRHLVNMAIAMCFAVQMWTCARYDFPAALLPFYALYTVLVPLSAFADVRKRYKKKESQ